jgi:hypothetical protein
MLHRRLLAILLCLATAAAFAACGSDDKKSDSKKSDSKKSSKADDSGTDEEASGGDAKTMEADATEAAEAQITAWEDGDYATYCSYYTDEGFDAVNRPQAEDAGLEGDTCEDLATQVAALLEENGIEATTEVVDATADEDAGTVEVTTESTDGDGATDQSILTMEDQGDGWVITDEVDPDGDDAAADETAPADESAAADDTVEDPAA